MNAIALPSYEEIDVELSGSEDLQRVLHVLRDRYGQISIYLRRQLPRTKKPLKRHWFESLASVSVSPHDADELIAIRYHDSGPCLWIGCHTWFDLLPAEADELIAKFGFKVRRESAQ